MEKGEWEVSEGEPLSHTTPCFDIKPPDGIVIKTEPAEHAYWTPEADHGHMDEHACTHGFSRDECKMCIPREGCDSVCDEDIKQEEAELGKGPVVMRGEDFWVEVDPAYKSDDETTMTCETKFESESDGIKTGIEVDSIAMRMAYCSDRLGKNEHEPEMTYQVKTEPQNESGGMEMCAEPKADDKGVLSVRMGLSSCFTSPCTVTSVKASVRSRLRKAVYRRRGRKKITPRFPSEFCSILPAGHQVQQTTSMCREGVSTEPPALGNHVPVMNVSGNFFPIVTPHAPTVHPSIVPSAAPVVLPSPHSLLSNSTSGRGITLASRTGPGGPVVDISGNIPGLTPCVSLTLSSVPPVSRNPGSSVGVGADTNVATGVPVTNISLTIVRSAPPSAPPACSSVPLQAHPSVLPMSRNTSSCVGVAADTRVATSVPVTNVSWTIVPASTSSVTSVCPSFQPSPFPPVLPVQNYITSSARVAADTRVATSIPVTNMSWTIVPSAPAVVPSTGLSIRPSILPFTPSSVLPVQNRSSTGGVAVDTRVGMSIPGTNVPWTLVPAVSAVAPSACPSSHPSIIPVPGNTIGVGAAADIRVGTSVPVTNVAWTLVPASACNVPSVHPSVSSSPLPSGLPLLSNLATSGGVAAADPSMRTSVPVMNSWTIVQAATPSVPSTPSVVPSWTIVPATTPSVPSILPSGSPSIYPPTSPPADTSAGMIIPVTNVSWTIVQAAPSSVPSSFPPPLPGPSNMTNGGCAMPLVVCPPPGQVSLQGMNVLPGNSHPRCATQASPEPQSKVARVILPKEEVGTPIAVVLVNPSASPAPVQKEQKTFVCWICEEKLDNDSQLLRHGRLVHGLTKMYPCDTCDKKCATRDSLENHQASMHQGHAKFPCPACPMQYPREGRLALHISVAHKDLQHYICGECGIRFVSKASRAHHVAKAHKAESSDMREHEAEGSDMIEHKAEGTDMIEHKAESSDMIEHKAEGSDMREHKAEGTDMREFSCGRCQRTFAGKEELKDHLASEHRAPGKFACKHCSKRFYRDHLLRIHVAIAHKELNGKVKSVDFDTL